MSTLYLGRGAYAGSGVEVTWGTAVTRTRWEYVTGPGLKRTRSRAVVDHMHGPSFGPNVRHQHLVSDRVAGSLAFRAHYGSTFLQRMLEAATGGTPATTGSETPWTHAFTLAAALPALTIEQGSGTGHAEVFSGCRVNRLTLGIGVGELMSVNADIIGKTSGGPVALGSPSLPTVTMPAWMSHHHAGVLSWNSVNYTVKRAEFVIDNKLAEREGLGSLNAVQIDRSALAEVMVRVTLNRLNNNFHTAHFADTESDGSLTFTSGAHSLAFAFHNATIDEYDAPASSVGPIEESVTFRCFSDGTDEGLKFTLINGNETV